MKFCKKDVLLNGLKKCLLKIDKFKEVSG